MHARLRHPLATYGVALAATALSLLVRWPLRPVLGNAVPQMTFFPAVMTAAYFGGLWPGVLATILSALAANYFVAAQPPAFHLSHVNDVAALILFILVGTFISALCESLHRVRRHLLAEERERAAQTVREAEQRFRQMAENIHEIFWVADLGHTRILYVSPGYDQIWGRSSQSLYEQPRSWIESIHADDRPAVIENLEQRRRGVFNDLEFRIVRPDGSMRWIRNRAFPINDPDGGLSRIAGLAEDITERKRGEAALREGEQRWRSLTEALPQLVWTSRPDGWCDSFSTQWTQHTGVPQDKLLGWGWLDTLHPDDREPTRAAWLAAVRGPGAYDVEYRVRRADGEYRWFKTRGVPIRDAAGEIVNWFGTCTDITEGKQLQEELRQANSRLDLAVRSSNMAIWEFEMPDGVFENAGVHHLNAAEQLGYARPQTPETYEEWIDLLHPDDRERIQQTVKAYLAGERRDYEVEYRVRHRDGTYRWVLSRGVVMRDAAGKPVLFTGSRIDITDRQRAEDDLRQLKEAAEAANRAKDEFLANVSHEIRTPMNAILGMTELVLDTPLGDDQRQSLRTVKSAADNLLGIINDLLDFS